MTFPRRALALLILAGLVALLLFAVALPVGEVFAEQGDALEQDRLDLAVYRAQIAARPRLEAELKTLRGQAAPTDALLGGDNEALAEASLQGLVKDLVERHGGQVRSAQALPASVSDGLQKIAVEYEVSLPAAALKSVTADLESRTPYLFLDAIEVRPEIVSGDATSAPANLHVQWTVHAYRREAN